MLENEVLETVYLNGKHIDDLKSHNNGHCTHKSIDVRGRSLKEHFGMTSSEIMDLYNWFKENNIDVWICGGWCVDALLGKQTREHQDFDIAVHRNDNSILRSLLENNDYQEEQRDDSSEFMYVMKNIAGLEVDIHAFEYDENGKNTYGVEFPYGSLTGTGTINGQTVKCISPEWMYIFNTSYDPKEKDIHDIQALCKKYGFVLPGKYDSMSRTMRNG
jgi:lincosamide nucleotidyltransferase A/C/D/E